MQSSDPAWHNIHTRLINSVKNVKHIVWIHRQTDDYKKISYEYYFQDDNIKTALRN
jgi:hypothetical protein